MSETIVASAALIVVAACAIALLGLLVVGLLVDQRRILAELQELEARRAVGPVAVSADLVGTSPAGDALVIHLAPDTGADRTLLAFLSSTCVTCRDLWAELAGDLAGRLPSGTRLVIVTQDGADERAEAVRALAPRRVSVLMSSAAWRRYAVSAAPYFVVVEGAPGRVAAEGTAANGTEILRLVQGPGPE